MSADELTQMSLRSAGKRARSVNPSMHNEHVVWRLCRRTPPETTSQLMFVNPNDVRLEPTRRLQQEDPGTKTREADANGSRFALALLMSKGDIVGHYRWRWWAQAHNSARPRG